MAKLTFGSCYFSTSAPTTLDSPAGTPVKAAGTTTAMLLEGFTHTDNRLTNTGVVRTYEVRFDGSVSKGGSQQDTQTVSRIFVNGLLVTGIGTARTIDNADDVGAFSVSGQVSLDTNDYIELWLETNDGYSLTVEAGVLSAKVIG
jgi:hypothetical protein